VHAKALGCLLGLLLNGSEEGVTEVAFTGRTAVRLNIVPEVVIGQLQNTREKSEESAVDGLGEVVAEFLDLIHEREQALWYPVLDVFPVGLVPVELFDTVRLRAVALANSQPVNICIAFLSAKTLTLNP
jgi:hypothetical protein